MLIVKADVDEMPDAAADYEVQAMPTFQFHKVHKRLCEYEHVRVIGMGLYICEDTGVCPNTEREICDHTCGMC